MFFWFKMNKNEINLFEDIKSKLLDLDPAYFVENNLTLDGEDFKILGNGWRFMVDIYRYISLNATKKDGKPQIIVEDQQKNEGKGCFMNRQCPSGFICKKSTTSNDQSV